MDEIVAYDFPAMFGTILANTDPNGKIIYIGHSLGTTLSLMYAAEFPEIARNTLKLMILISPAYTLTNMKSPYRLAAPFGSAIIVSFIHFLILFTHNFLLPKQIFH
jgi:lysosomal acid lipase/cholesteryl ester hydrolase